MKTSSVTKYQIGVLEDIANLGGELYRLPGGDWTLSTLTPVLDQYGRPAWYITKRTVHSLESKGFLRCINPNAYWKDQRFVGVLKRSNP